VKYGLSSEQLAIRLVQLLAEKATRNRQTFSRWATLTRARRRIFSEAVAEGRANSFDPPSTAQGISTA
jgi:hypothetical protein